MWFIISKPETVLGTCVHHWQLRQTHAALQSLTRKMLVLNLVSFPMLSQVYSSYSTVKIGLNRDVWIINWSSNCTKLISTSINFRNGHHYSQFFDHSKVDNSTNILHTTCPNDGGHVTAVTLSREKSPENVSRSVNGLPKVVSRQTKKCEWADFSVNATQKSVNGPRLFRD